MTKLLLGSRRQETNPADSVGAFKIVAVKYRHKSVICMVLKYNAAFLILVL